MMASEKSDEILAALGGGGALGIVTDDFKIITEYFTNLTAGLSSTKWHKVTVKIWEEPCVSICGGHRLLSYMKKTVLFVNIKPC